MKEIWVKDREKTTKEKDVNKRDDDYDTYDCSAL